ncbi:MAG: zinc-binding dehydrogenase, partial [Opitutus sp.]
SRAEIMIPEIMRRRLTITGSTLRSRDGQFKAALAADIETSVWPSLASRRFSANVFRSFALADAAEAHRLMESSQHIGKIVLEVST